MLQHCTTVPAKGGPVLVTTIRHRQRSEGQGGYETLVYRFKPNGDVDQTLELHRVVNLKPKYAKRAHREVCQGFDCLNRPYKFDDFKRRYEPIGILPAVRAPMQS